MIQNAHQKSKANLVLKVLDHVVNGVGVRVPVLTNHKDIPAGEELMWDKTTAKKFHSMRYYVAEADFKKGSKKRKVDA